MTEFYARVPFTFELIGPYDTSAECKRESIVAHAGALENLGADYTGSCPACGGSGILSDDEAQALSLVLSKLVESGYCPLCEASGTFPPFYEEENEDE
jgi:hypothetical protein